MNSTTSLLICVYIAAIFLQGFMAFSYVLATWAKTTQALNQTAAVASYEGSIPTHLTFDAIEPTAGQ